MLLRIRDLTGATAADVAVAFLLGVTAEIDVFVGSGWQGPRLVNAAVVERERDQVGAAAVGDERRRIARELHDISSHSLGVVVLQAGAAEQVLERDPERAREVLRSIRATGQQAIGEMGTMLELVRGE